MEPSESFVTRINNNDTKAFKKLFEGFYPSVCVFAYKYVKSSDLAEDFAQEAFVEFWKRKENFTDLKAIKGFIYTVTRNKCLNHLKIQNIRDNILNEVLSSDDFFYEMILEEETYRIVHQAVDKLPPQMRKIVWLSLEGNKNQAIADQLEISVNTVKTLKKNAYKELRNQLKGSSFVLFLLSYFLN